jgi:hypothetical protein
VKEINKYFKEINDDLKSLLSLLRFRKIPNQIIKPKTFKRVEKKSNLRITE